MARMHDFTEDCYAVLGVARDAPDEEIRRAARSKQREAHPDLGGSSEAFVRVRLAAEVLTDPSMRAEHDAWLDSRGRGGRRLRVQRRGSRAAQGTRGRGRAGAAGPGGSAESAGGAPQQPFGPTGARRAPGTYVPKTEAAPPDRIPKPQADVRRMAWFRTAWREAPLQWPPAVAKLPALTARELGLVIAHTVVIVATVLLLSIPASIAVWRVPWFGGEPLALWPLVAVFALVGIAWMLCRVFVRARVFARIAYGATLVASIALGALSLGIALVTLTFSPDLFTDDTFVRTIVQVALFAAYAATGFALWRALEFRVRATIRERLLVDLAQSSAPGVDEPARVWGRPGQAAMGGEDTPIGVNPMRAKLAQQVVGEALGQLQRMPSVRIVHGIRAAGLGTVAHAVVAGRNIALIDAQLWRPGTYGVGVNGMITRDGGEITSAAAEFPHVVERFHRLFGETAKVKGWIAVLPESEGELDIDTSRTWQRVRLATLNDTLREVGDWLAPEGERVDRLLLRDLLRHRA
ncbi:MAG: J domain-containing protein [Pseudoclavibacter sp.]